MAKSKDKSKANSKDSEPAFELCGGDPALDFVNTLDHRFREEGPKELLTSYGDLLRFSGQSKLLEPPRLRVLANAVGESAGARALRSARELREAMAALFYARVDAKSPSPEAVRTLERHVHEAGRHKKLRWDQSAKNGNRGLAWDWDRSGADEHLPAWMLAQAAVKLLTSDELERVRACGAANCRWLFLDTSKNHTRRWCNMKVCGNRMKARRFQARQG
ncbi:MAG TPA: ABATE domain-containing protein [Rhizomicrobium sp.]|nr:ABATE domain-containing protein [Rhizomicrobium sp.]